MLKDKVFYLTITSTGGYGLRKYKSSYRFFTFTLDELQQTTFITKFQKDKGKIATLDIVLASDTCRFVILPPLQNYPEPDVLEFLIQQKFQQKYIDYEPSQFIILHDNLKFNIPCLVSAFPREIYQRIIQLQKNIKIKSLLPSILAVWNYYEKEIMGSKLLIIENQFAFLICHEEGNLQDIDTFPVYLTGSLSFDYYIDLNNLSFSINDENSLYKRMSNLSEDLLKINQESIRDHKEQTLNFMRMSS